MGQLAFGTKCSWDFWHLGQFTFFWDRYALGQKVLGQNVIGTIYLWAESVWDNSPRVNHLWDKRYWENPQGTISLGLFTVHHQKPTKHKESSARIHKQYNKAESRSGTEADMCRVVCK